MKTHRISASMLDIADINGYPTHNKLGELIFTEKLVPKLIRLGADEIIVESIDQALPGVAEALREQLAEVDIPVTYKWHRAKQEK